MSSTYEGLSPVRQLMALLLLMLGVGMIGNLIAEGLLQLNGLSLFTLADAVDINPKERLWLRIGLMINHFSMFLGAAIAFAWIFHRNTFYEYIRTNTPVSIDTIAIWGLIILSAYPLVAFLTALNISIPLPEWARTGQDNAFQLLGNILQMNGIGDLFISLILVALLPALGEELIFRGIVQNKLSELIANPHIAILIASLLFGLTHMQLERILPLSFLGLLLGYSYYYSRSIIVPIILHLLNNGLQVVSLYSIGKIDQEIIENTPELPPMMVITSLLIVVGLFLLARRRQVQASEITT